jgi:hypothetical protein
MQLPLSTLLSQVLVAFTIEFDNEFEHRSPHRTTLNKSGRGPWLTSMVMYLNCLQFVGETGITVSELKRMARTDNVSLPGMQRWGYLVVESDIVRPTPGGLRARAVWRPLFSEIEGRWEQRFGRTEIENLRKSLATVVCQLGIELPEYLPILGYGLSARLQARKGQAPAPPHLPSLLSQVLLAFTLDFEQDWPLSLAISANVIRVLSEQGARRRDLPQISGVSKEAIQMALGFLQKRGLVSADPTIRLTPKGLDGQEAYHERLNAIEGRWTRRFPDLKNSLQPLAGDRLQLGLEPYPEGWRAKVRKPDALPHYPMVLHRGGYPDGS